MSTTIQQAGLSRPEVREWLEANVASADAQGDDDVEARRRWERRLYEAGYAAIHWPASHGGRDATLADRMMFQEEYERVAAPSRLNPQGLQLVGPTVMHFGTEQQQERWLRPILTCEEIWCQGYSEPDAGSDLANIRTRAVEDGEDLIVNGQKIWTSSGLYADWMHAIVRTSSDGRKHDGLTYLMIDMHSPGIDVRPIKQVNGKSSFAEVFFSDVRVPVANVIGEIGQGWRVAMTTLSFERGTGRRTYVQFMNDLVALRKLVEWAPADVRGDHADELGELFRKVLVFRHHVNRTIVESNDGAVGPEASYNKLYWSDLQTQIYDLGMRILGPHAELEGEIVAGVDAWDWQDTYWYSRATRIFAGTQEIQKNIIAERVLGLPREPRA